MTVDAISPPKTPLRMLSQDDLNERYGADRFTLTVLSNRFAFVIDNMVQQLYRTAFSPVVRAADFAVTLSGPPSVGYTMAGVSQTLPVFIGSLPDAVRITLEEYGLERLRPRDVITVNDYYRVGTHLNDVCFIRPVFDGEDIVSILTIRCHQLDMGGVRAGGFQATKASSFEDGLVLPPMLLFSDGQPVASTMNLIMNNTRFGSLLRADMRTIHSCLDLGESLIMESIGKYGVDAFLGAIRYLDDSSAESMEAALANLPDGIFEGCGYLDGDNLADSDEYVVRVRINKRGGRAEFDFSGTSAAARSAVNCSWPDTKTALAVSLKCLIDPLGRFTSGSLRSVDLVVPPDSFINPSPPHSCQFYWEPLITIMIAVYDALTPVLGADGVAFDGCPMFNFVTGVRPDGSEWVEIDGVSTPWGASSAGDGDSSQLSILFNSLSLGPEEKELIDPSRRVLLTERIVTDSAGPGRHRGGAATMSDTLWIHPAAHFPTNYHLRRSPGAGVDGGGVGRRGGGWIWDGSASPFDAHAILPRSISHEWYAASAPLVGVVDDDTNELDPRGGYHTVEAAVEGSAGSIVRLVSNGAGGWGDPMARDVDSVLRDVRDEYVSVAGAARDYGVVVLGDPIDDPEGLTVDHATTARLRLAASTQPT